VPSTDAAKADRFVMPVLYWALMSGPPEKSPLTMSIAPVELTEVTTPTWSAKDGK
jgi:hypothetical protein